LEHGRAVGPDGDGAATRLRIRPLFEQGDVVPVTQQSPGNGDAADPGAGDEDPQAFPPHAPSLAP